MSLLVGDLVAGRYRLASIIGQGGQAQVFLATDERTGKRVAVKTIQLVGPGEQTHRARFAREVKALSLLDHPSILRLLDVDASGDGDPWVATEFLDGQDLQAIIDERGRLPEVVVFHIAERVFSALREAHAVSVAHRDIKPANIFVCNNGRVVLIDFGVARGTEVNSSETMVGSAGTAVVGTPYFISPEQLRGVRVSLLSDIYTMGITLQYALTGEVPFSGDMAEVLQAIVQGTRRPVRMHPIALVSSLADMIEACVEVEPTARLQSADDALSLLTHSAKHFPEREAEFLRWLKGSAASSETMIATAPAKKLSASMSESVAHRGAFAKTRLIALAVAVILGVTLTFRWLTARHELPTPPSAALIAPAPSPIVAPESTPDTSVLPPAPAAPERVMVLSPTVETQPEPAQAKKRSPRVSAKPAILVLDMQQWGDVTIDADNKGRRQLTARFELNAGRHTVRVVNPAYGQKTWELALEADETRLLRVDLKTK